MSTLKVNILTLISLTYVLTHVFFVKPNINLGMDSQTGTEVHRPMDQCAVCPNLT
jgi:hypothetical protein